MATLQDLLGQAQALIKSQPLMTAATAGTVTLLAYIIHDIRSYIALGPHGLPDTVWGWYRQLRMTPMSRRDTCVPLPPDVDMTGVASRYPPHSRDKSFFLSNTNPLEPRLGSRPSVCKFVAPQRQYDDRASEAFKDDMFAYLEDLAALNPSILKMENSVLEGPVPALQLRDEVRGPEILYFKFMKNPVAELLHIHPPDGSTHIELSLEDSRTVIEKGWGQRHRLSGKMLPFGYTFLYAPRNRAEMGVWKEVVTAAVRFATAEMEGEVEFPS